MPFLRATKRFLFEWDSSALHVQWLEIAARFLAKIFENIKASFITITKIPIQQTIAAVILKCLNRDS